MSITASTPIGVTADDLAPADLRSADFDWTGFTISFIGSTAHPRFDAGYDALWGEFGAKNEMEQRDVIEQRMQWRPEHVVGRRAMLYEMVVVRYEDELAAVRDHTAIVDLDHPGASVTVHLSHLLIMPRFRGSGLAGWMRAMPIRTARECLERAHQPVRPITLVAEMEPADPTRPDCVRRLAAYEKVGFLKINPRRVHYLQPDFRTSAQIDGSSVQPVPLSLVVRRVKREDDLTIPGHEIKTLVQCLFTMYAQTFRAADMQPNWDSLANYPGDQELVDLVPPTRID